jgi:hypothetical protein
MHELPPGFLVARLTQALQQADGGRRHTAIPEPRFVGQTTIL